MAHYAFIDENNIVTEVIPGKDENELIDGLEPEVWYGNFRGQTCKRTSYNTYRDKDGVSHHHTNGVPYRGAYAAIGHIYDSSLDEFISPPVEE